MKIFVNILLAGLLLVLSSCAEESPVELKDDIVSADDPLEVEVITSDPETYVYTNGYDSTGVVSPVLSTSSFVAVSSIKYTIQNKLFRASRAQAIFTDKSQPVKLPSGKTLGFRTRAQGTVRFDNIPARIQPYRIKYRYQSALRDTLLGTYYLLSRKEGRGDDFNFRHDSKISFSVRSFQGKQEHYEINTPGEISGEVIASGSFSRGNPAFVLKWNSAGEGTVEIIIGAAFKSGDDVTPYYRLTTRDDGQLKIPAYLLKNFPYSSDSRLVFSFIRKKVSEFNSELLNDVSIQAQSIHNIQYDIP